jgi:hypothetical protein
VARWFPLDEEKDVIDDQVDQKGVIDYKVEQTAALGAADSANLATITVRVLSPLDVEITRLTQPGAA